MAHEWFVKRADSEQGPLSAAQMKQLASSGQIVATDLVRRADMGDWKQAGSIKGLFSDSPGNQQHGEQEPPQNTPERSGDNSGVDVGVKAKEGAKALGNSARLAGQLAAKQTELTTIKQSTLSTEFGKLGAFVFDNVQPTEELQGLYGEIQSLNSTIESLHAQSNQTPATESFADKAKALGNKTVIATKLKVAEHDRRKKLVQLGEAAFQLGHVPENYSSEKSKIEDLLARVEVLQAEISDIKQQLSAQTAEVAKAGRNLLYSTAVVVSSAIFCAPFGLFLIWRHPTWEKPTKLKWAGISVACFLGFMVIGNVQRSASLKELASADQLWDNGDQVEAIEKYRELTEESFLPSNHRPRVYRRVIEFDCEHDNLESAKALIERANRFGVELTLTNPQAKSLLESVAQATRSNGKDLTDDFYPFEAGTTRQTISKVDLPTGTMQSRIEITHLGSGTIRRRKINHFAMPGNVELPLGQPEEQKYRQTGGFIQVSQEIGVSQKQMVSLPVLKLGAHIGDDWEFNDGGMKIVYTLRAFENKEIHIALNQTEKVLCAIVDETWFFDGKPTLKTETTYGKGLGPIRVQVSMSTAGGGWETTRTESLIPTLQE